MAQAPTDPSGVDFGSGRIFHRRILTIPAWCDLTTASRERLIAADRLLPKLSAIDFSSCPSSFMNGLDPDLWGRLRHDLSWCFLDANVAPDDWCFKSGAESAALSRVEDFLEYALAKGSPALFTTALMDACSLALAARAIYRVGEMSVGTTEARGGRVVFPHCVLAQQRVRGLTTFLASAPYPARTLTAIVGMVCLTNAHPFINGNGRTSRILFNWLLRRGGMSAKVYLPLYEMIGRSQGGFQLRVRQAEIRGEWDGIVEYGCDILEAMPRTNRSYGLACA